jgi:hypothetical protein
MCGGPGRRRSGPPRHAPDWTLPIGGSGAAAEDEPVERLHDPEGTRV